MAAATAADVQWDISQVQGTSGGAAKRLERNGEFFPPSKQLHQVFQTVGTVSREPAVRSVNEVQRGLAELVGPGALFWSRHPVLICDGYGTSAIIICPHRAMAVVVNPLLWEFRALFMRHDVQCWEWNGRKEHGVDRSAVAGGADDVCGGRCYAGYSVLAVEGEGVACQVGDVSGVVVGGPLGGAPSASEFVSLVGILAGHGVCLFPACVPVG